MELHTVHSLEKEEVFLAVGMPELLVSVLVPLLLIGTSIVYFWRRHIAKERIERQKTEIVGMIEEALHGVKEERIKQRERMGKVKRRRKGLPAAIYLVAAVGVAVLFVGGWTGAVRHFPPWSPPTTIYMTPTPTQTSSTMTYQVSGSDMAPTISDGQYVTVDLNAYRNAEPERGDMILFHLSDLPQSNRIMRIIGLPGETVEVETDGSAYINGNLLEEPYLTQKQPGTSGTWPVPEAEFFVMGDNRSVSYDSREGGPVPQDNIVGKILLAATNPTPTLASTPVPTPTPTPTTEPTTSVASGNVLVDASYSGRQVELSVGQLLIITLESNATTGYSWTLTQNSDESVLQRTGNKYIAPQTTSIGTAGNEEWTFKALKEGTSMISMGYSRPWESTPPVETFGLTVAVKTILTPTITPTPTPTPTVAPTPTPTVAPTPTRVTFPVGTLPLAICFDGTNIWVAGGYGDSVTKLRPSDGSVLGTYAVGHVPHALCFDGANIWVANYGNNSVTKLRASDGSFVGNYAVGSYPWAICYDGANIWVTSQNDPTVTKLKASDGSLVGTYAAGTTPRGMCFDGAYIWVANSLFNGTVTKLKASDGSLVGTYSVGSNPSGICFDGANIWVANLGSDNVTKLRASDGSFLGNYAVGSLPWAICYDGVNIWVANNGSASVTKLRASDGSLVGNYTVGQGPCDVYYDGANIWVVNNGSGSVSKL
jgi:signal peptidase I